MRALVTTAFEIEDGTIFGTNAPAIFSYSAGDEVVALHAEYAVSHGYATELFNTL